MKKLALVGVCVNRIGKLQTSGAQRVPRKFNGWNERHECIITCRLGVTAIARQGLSTIWQNPPASKPGAGKGTTDVNGRTPPQVISTVGGLKFLLVGLFVASAAVKINSGCERGLKTDE